MTAAEEEKLIKLLDSGMDPLKIKVGNVSYNDMIPFAEKIRAITGLTV